MISVVKRRAIKRLLDSGALQEDVARALDVSLRSVKRIAKEPTPPEADDTLERRRRGIGRPCQVARFDAMIVGWLTARPRISATEIVQNLRELGFEGSRSSAFAHVKYLREHFVELEARQATARRARRLQTDVAPLPPMNSIDHHRTSRMSGRH